MRFLRPLLIPRRDSQQLLATSLRSLPMIREGARTFRERRDTKTIRRESARRQGVGSSSAGAE
jgi:hypothetical protein